jgi:glycerol-3-phosphate O-acyltransferase/dihydroxyacetone phosphate acyltransferase
MPNEPMTSRSSRTNQSATQYTARPTLLYAFIRPFARIGLKLFFKKVYLSNIENIPSDKPVIIAANHPTAFLEPCILACFLDRPLFFLVRGDFFKKKFYATLLRSLQMLPVYRMKDGGYKKLRNNYATFQSCFDALREHKTIMILAEGSTIHEKRLRPIQKGTARIALGALEAYPDLEDIYIVPVGVNYTYAERFRSTVMIDCGTPITARQFLDADKDQGDGIQAITNTLREELAERIVIIENPLDDDLAEQLLLVFRNDRSHAERPLIDSDRSFLEAEQHITNQVNALTADDKAVIRKKGDTYFEALNAQSLTDSGLLNRGYKGGWIDRLFLVLGALPALAGYLWHAIPLQLAKFGANKTKHIEFFAPVWWAASSMLTLFWYAIAIVVGVILHIREFYLILVVMPFLGYFALRYWDALQRVKKDQAAKAVSGAVIAQLLQLRQEFKSSFSSVVGS